MPIIDKDEAELDVTGVGLDISVKSFLDACDDEDLDEVYDYIDEKGLIEKEVEEVEVEVGLDLPNDGSYSDKELNDAIGKISDARLQLTNEDLEDLKRIAGKYR